MRPGREPGLKGLVLFSKFVVVGLGNAVVDLGIFNGLYQLQPTRNINLLVVYNTLGVIGAMLNSYWWNSRWTFWEATRKKGPSRRQRGLFFLQSLVNVLINDTILWFLGPLVLAAHILPVVLANNLAKMAAMFVASMLSFLVMRYIVFSSRSII